MTSTVPEALSAFFDAHPRLALAFSGGVDSAYLLYAAAACGCDVLPLYVRSAFQPDFEYRDALKLANEVGVELRVIEADILSNGVVCSNPPDRCYHCKRVIFSSILETARAQGYLTVMDGTNASDDAGDRPGMRALREMQVLSPLRLCGITKAQVRAYSKAAGLFTHDKPAYACLATRIPAGELITRDKLCRVEQAEAALFDLGFSDFRVRLFHGAARLQLPAAQLPRAIEMRQAIREALKPWFEVVLVDTQAR